MPAPMTATLSWRSPITPQGYPRPPVAADSESEVDHLTAAAEPAAATCAACGHTGLEPHFQVRGEAGSEGLIPTTKEFGTALGDIVRCPACGHMQLDRFPTEEELADEYERAASDDYVEEEAGQRQSARATLERIERYARGGT